MITNSKKPIIITIVYAFTSDGSNYLNQALGLVCHNPSSDVDFVQVEGEHFSSTALLEFQFSKVPILFWRMDNTSQSYICDRLLNQSQGVIVSLASEGLNEMLPITFETNLSPLKIYLEFAHQRNLPTIIAINGEEQIQVETLTTAEDFDNLLNQAINSSSIIYPNIIKSVKDILKVPPEISILYYNQQNPASIENLLKILLEKIEKNIY